MKPKSYEKQITIRGGQKFEVLTLGAPCRSEYLQLGPTAGPTHPVSTPKAYNQEVLVVRNQKNLQFICTSHSYSERVSRARSLLCFFPEINFRCVCFLRTHHKGTCSCSCAARRIDVGHALELRLRLRGVPLQYRLGRGSRDVVLHAVLVRKHGYDGRAAARRR